MYEYEDKNMGDWWKDAREAGKKLLKATDPIKMIKQVIKNPKKGLDPRVAIKQGIKMGKAAEVFTSSINPLNTTLRKFDELAIKKGGKIGGFLGRTGELARKNPIATTAIVYSAVLAVKALAGGSAATAAGSGTAGGIGASTAATVASTALSVAGNKKDEQTSEEQTQVPSDSKETETERVEANMFGDKKNVALFLGLGALTAIGYFIFNPPTKKG